MATAHRLVVIVGAGCAGLGGAHSGSHADALILDRDSYRTFLPLGSQLATAEQEPKAIIIFLVWAILRRQQSAGQPSDGGSSPCWPS